MTYRRVFNWITYTAKNTCRKLTENGVTNLWDGCQIGLKTCYVVAYLFVLLYVMQCSSLEEVSIKSFLLHLNIYIASQQRMHSNFIVTWKSAFDQTLHRRIKLLASKTGKVKFG